MCVKKIEKLRLLNRS